MYIVRGMTLPTFVLPESWYMTVLTWNVAAWHRLCCCAKKYKSICEQAMGWALGMTTIITACSITNAFVAVDMFMESCDV